MLCSYRINNSHHFRYVRQGVLFAVSMLIGATPPHTLMKETEGALGEAIQWLTELRLNDADEQCRTLATHALGMLNAALKPTGEVFSRTTPS